MAEGIHIIRRVMRTSALCGMLTLFAAPAFGQSSFDPSADPEISSPASVPKGKLIFQNPAAGNDMLLSPTAAMAAPLVGSSPLPDEPDAVFPATTAPVTVVSAPASITPPQPAAAAAPMALVQPPLAPLHIVPPALEPAPAPIVAAAPINKPVPILAAAPAPVTVVQPAPTSPSMPNLPPVDPAVMRQAQQEISAHPGIIAAPPNFASTLPPLVLTPPQPVIETPVVAAASPVTVAPVAVAPVKMVYVPPTPIVTSSSVGAVAPEPIPSSVGAAMPDAPLSPSTKAILNKLPSKIATPPRPAGGKLNVSRMTPDLKPVADPDTKSYNAVGLSIKVAKPGMDTNFQLNRAYTALMGGDSPTAIETYKSVLANEPGNQDALFGLASTYHRSGELDKARPYYGELLKVNPSHREGLNNFLALVAEESPNEALVELSRLEQKNPDFSPIPAQEAVVMNKLGYYDQAREKMLRAIELAPENFSYKYNLAVMMDRHGDYTNAIGLYRMLIDASLRGEKLPASTEVLQKRLNYITAASASNASVVPGG